LFVASFIFRLSAYLFAAELLRASQRALRHHGLAVSLLPQNFPFRSSFSALACVWSASINIVPYRLTSALHIR
jgi:hypothetical protein